MMPSDMYKTFMPSQTKYAMWKETRIEKCPKSLDLYINVWNFPSSINHWLTIARVITNWFCVAKIIRRGSWCSFFDKRFPELLACLSRISNTLRSTFLNRVSVRATSSSFKPKTTYFKPFLSFYQTHSRLTWEKWKNPLRTTEEIWIQLRLNCTNLTHSKYKKKKWRMYRSNLVKLWLVDLPVSFLYF